MTRLADRMLVRCDPARASSLWEANDIDEYVRKELLSGRALDEMPSGALRALINNERAGFRSTEQVSTTRFEANSLSGLPVVAADDVALYVHGLPIGTNIADVVASMAPPFSRFFIEFQGVPNRFGLSAWGACITADDYTRDRYPAFEGDPSNPRWILTLELFLEREKDRPLGPVSSHMVGLAEDGTWFRHWDGAVWWAGGPVGFEPSPPREVTKFWGDQTAQMLFPVLLAISFMHCKNVSTRDEEPSEALSKKRRRKHGHELIRFQTLEIEPLRRILERHRTPDASGLRNALHICRGHFKTFSADAPLMGRHAGTYWWSPQVRGSSGQGVVLKDYRVNAPIELGRAYRDADESTEEPHREASPSRDPDSTGRGRAAHAQTQNQIAADVRELGWLPRSPKPEEPEFDLAWATDVGVFVCEVKSITPQNEERQLRMAIGQVIRYRQKLAAAGHEPMTAVIATEVRPSDRSWDDLCRGEGIILVWPGEAKERLEAGATALRLAGTT